MTKPVVLYTQNCRLVCTCTPKPGAVVVVIVWLLDLQLPVQLVPITKVVSSNPDHGEVCLIQHYVIKYVSVLKQVSGFLRVLWFPPPIKLKYC